MQLALDPKSDIVFKLLFSHPARRELLIALLEAVLKPDIPIASVELLDPTLPKANVSERGLVLDLRLRLSEGRLIDVEMQIALHGGLRERILANASCRDREPAPNVNWRS